MPAHQIELPEGIQLRWTRIEERAEMTMDPGTAAVLQAHQDAAHSSPSSPDSTLPPVEVRASRAMTAAAASSAPTWSSSVTGPSC